MNNWLCKVPVPSNEPLKTYAPGSQEKKELRAKLRELQGDQLDIPW